MVQYQTNACKIVQFKITWTLALIERSTLVDSVLWNHSRPSVTPPVLRLSITKFSQDWIISFFLVLYMTIAGHDI